MTTVKYDYGYKGNNTMEILHVRVTKGIGFIEDTYLQYLPNELLDLIFKEVYKEGMVMHSSLPITIIFRETKKYGNNSVKMLFASANDDTRGGKDYVEEIPKKIIDMDTLKYTFQLKKVPNKIYAFENGGKNHYLNGTIIKTEKYTNWFKENFGSSKIGKFNTGTLWLQVDRKKQ